MIGFVEAKDVDKSLKATLKTSQLKRYLEALPNLLLTNSLAFPQSRDPETHGDVAR